MKYERFELSRTKHAMPFNRRIHAECAGESVVNNCTTAVHIACKCDENENDY